MPWIKVDDHYDEHRKFAEAGPLGHALWLAGMAYCNRNLTDGYIPWGVARNLMSWEFLGDFEDGVAPIYRVAVATVDDRGDDDFEVVDCWFVINILLRVGLWERDGSGYRVHDYSQYQPTKAQVEADRAAKVAAGQAGGRAAARARATAGAQADEQQTSSRRPSTIQARTRTRTRTSQLGSDEPSATGAHDAYDVMLVVQSLTNQGFDYREGHRIHDTLTGDVANHGAEKMAAEYRAFHAAHPGPLDAAQIVFGVHNALHPLIAPDRQKAEEQRRDQESEAAWQRRVAAQRARNADMRKAMGYDDDPQPEAAA